MVGIKNCCCCCCCCCSLATGSDILQDKDSLKSVFQSKLSKNQCLKQECAE